MGTGRCHRGGGDESSSLSESSSSSSRNEWDPIIIYDESDSSSWDESIYTDGLQAEFRIMFKPRICIDASTDESITEYDSYTFRYTVDFDNAAIVDLTSCYTEVYVDDSRSPGAYGDDDPGYNYNDWYAENNRTYDGCTYSAGPVTWHVTHRVASGFVTYGAGVEDKSASNITVDEAEYYLYASIMLEPDLEYSDLAVTLSGDPSPHATHIVPISEYCTVNIYNSTLRYRETGNTGTWIKPNITYISYQ